MEDIILFSAYLEALKASPPADATEHTYRTPLETLLISVSTQYDTELSIQHEPKRQIGFGAPDFSLRKAGGILGYVETKKIDENLDKILNSEQIQKYRRLSKNILLTDYLEFILIKGDEIAGRVRLCYSTDLANKRYEISQTNAQAVHELLRTFFSFAPEGVADGKTLARLLAVRAADLKIFLYEQLQMQQDSGRTGKLSGLYQTFKTSINPEMQLADFADAFAQTLAYSLFLARLNADTQKISLRNAPDHIPNNFQLIRELSEFLTELNKGEYKTVRWIIEEILNVLNHVDLRSVQESLSFSSNKRDADGFVIKDPYVYFYEDFLHAYDKNIREMRGVYYTPPAIVNFIVRSVDQIIKDVFNISDGLADRKQVTVLDFATGTGTFLLEVAQQILSGLPASSGKKTALIQEHILKNLFGFEYLIAPYAVAHLKLAQFLKENGYELQDDERFQIYLTNTLEYQENIQMNAFVPTLSAEGARALHLKKTPILVILGNPPYSGHSLNNSKWIKQLLEDYKKIEGVDLGERNTKWLQDDYVKFIRFAQWKMQNVEQGVVGIITNHSFLDNPTFRGMRASLLKSFDRLYFLDLHGNAKKKEKAPDGGKDENVFDIQQGTAITFLVKAKGLSKGVFHWDLYGKREHKYHQCAILDLYTTPWQTLTPTPPGYYFIPQDAEFRPQYDNFWSLKDIFTVSGVGITTAHDEFVIGFSKEVLLKRFIAFKNAERNAKLLHQKFSIVEKKGWDILKGWDNLQSIENIGKLIQPITYRPFDVRSIFYEEKLVWRVVKQVMQHFLEGGNIGLITTRQVKARNTIWEHCFVTETITESSSLSNLTSEINCVFPLFVYSNERGVLSQNEGNARVRQENFTPAFRAFIDDLYGESYSPEMIFGYLYAVLHSPTYREKYATFLRLDFPRVPFTPEKEIFEALSALGSELVQAHLLKGVSTAASVHFIGEANNKVEKPDFKVGKDEKGGRLYINSTQYFEGITPEVFGFKVGGYQPMEKYLKDRKGRVLSLDEIETVENIAKAISFTLSHTKKIDLLTQAWV